MPDHQSFADIIDAWPSPSQATLAADLGETPANVWKWRTRNRIPEEYWLGLTEAARRRKIRGVTAERLMRLAAERSAARA